MIDEFKTMPLFTFVMFFFFQAEDGIRDLTVTGVQTCALPISRSWGVSSGAPMVRLPTPDGVRAVQLLVHEQPGELVGERQPRQAPHALRALEHGLRHPLGAADREGDVPAVHLPAGRPTRQLLGGPLLPPLRQDDEARPLGHRLEETRLVLCLPLLHPRVVLQPRQVVIARRPERHGSQATHRDDATLHHAYMPRTRCIAATRSTASM